MISSASAISNPLEPDAREDQGGAAFASHPEREVLLQENETRQRQRGDGYAGDDISWPSPNADDDVAGGNDKRNEGGGLPWTDRPQHEKSSGEKCNQRHGHCAIAPTSLAARAAERRKSGDQSDRHNRAPDRACVGRKEVLQA